MKVVKKPWTALFPSPVFLVSCVDTEGKPNIITLAWAGTLCSDPPTLGLGIRPERYSYNLLKDLGEFVVNIPTWEVLEESDFCGVTSGRKTDKFLETRFTAEKAMKVKAPLIRECPVNLECVVEKIYPLGTHHLFLGRIVLVHVREEILNEDGRIDFTRIKPFVFNQGEYWSLGEKIGESGFTKKADS